MIELISVLLRIRATGNWPIEFEISSKWLRYEIWEHHGHKAKSRTMFLKTDKEAIEEISNLLNYL